MTLDEARRAIGSNVICQHPRRPEGGTPRAVMGIITGVHDDGYVIVNHTSGEPTRGWAPSHLSISEDT